MLEKVIKSYKNSTSLFQQNIFKDIENKKIKVFETNERSHELEGRIYINHKNYKENVSIKVILNHEIVHSMQNKPQFVSFFESIPTESHFFFQLLRENHANTFQEIFLTYEEILDINKKIENNKLDKNDKYVLRKTEQFFNLFTRLRKKIGAKPKALLKKTVQNFFINQFSYADVHLRLYKEQTLQMKKNKKVKVSNAKENIEAMICMLMDTIPLTLRDFPFPNDEEMQEALKKENLNEVINLIDDTFLEDCFKELNENVSFFNKQGEMILFEEALKIFKKATEVSNAKTEELFL